jgi:hypothetical protein
LPAASAASARASSSLIPGASGCGAGAADRAGSGRRRLGGRRTAFDQIIELRFDVGGHDGTPLLAVLHEADHDHDLHRAAILGLLALADQVDDLAVRDCGEPVVFFVDARPHPQALRQRGVKLLRGGALELGQ